MNEDEYGDFEEVVEEGSENQEGEQVSTRVRLPKGKELIGKIIQRLGGNRMEVLSTDGKTRNSRVPGRYRRRMWLRPGDFVIILPWEDNDDKADIIFQYRKNQAYQLKKKGFVDSLKDEF